jgi:hypothetical protein
VPGDGIAGAALREITLGHGYDRVDVGDAVHLPRGLEITTEPNGKIVVGPTPLAARRRDPQA